MIYTIESESLRVSVDCLGAQLTSIFSKKSNIEYLWQGDPKYWTGRAYNLFPQVGRFADGKYVVDGNEYAMDRHGFARGSEFCLSAKTKSSMTFTISATDKTLGIYPFKFIFNVTYAVKESKLSVLYEVKNVGDKTMYFGLGGHPGFNVPFDGGKFEDYYTEFECECVPTQIIANEKGLMTSERKPLSLEKSKIIRLEHGLFDNDALIMQDSCKVISIKGKSTEKSVKVSFPKMSYLGLWHMPKTDAPYLCIEPWMTLPSPDGSPEAFETKEHIGKAHPNESFSSGFDIEIVE